MKILKTIIRRLLLWGNVALAAGLLFAAFAQYIRPEKFWPAGFAGFAFPFFLVLSIALAILWLFFKGKKRYYCLISVVAIVLSVQAIRQSWGFHFFHSTAAPAASDFSIMSYNCSMFGMREYQDNADIRQKIYTMLANNQADILCLQEFYSNDAPDRLHNLDSVALKAGYPHYYFSKDFTRWDTWHFGTAIFSKFPLVKAETVQMFGGPETENMIRADVVVGKDTVRILSVHLKSYQFNQGDYSKLGAVNNGNIKQTRGVFGKMKATFTVRDQQTDIVTAEKANSPYPVIVTGDLNAIPVSYTYNQVRGTLGDAFLSAGAGFGRTFTSLAPTLRIDYILPDKRFSVKDFKIDRSIRFEHFPVMARLSLAN